MQRIKILFVVLVLSVAAPASAQLAPGNVPVGGGTIARLLEIEIVSGRLQATSLHMGTTRNSSTTSDSGRRERLTLDLTNAAPNLRYELVDKAVEVTLQVTDGKTFLIRHASKDDKGTRSIELSQIPDQPLVLSMETPEGKHVVGGSTLWHILLAEPAISQQMLIPAVELLRPNWKLEAVADAVEVSLCQNARLRRTVDLGRWNAWVGDLANPRYGVRRAAERQLLSTGREVLPFLRGLERDSLDTEQWRRIRNIIASLDNDQSDSVEQTVTMLAGDARIWVSLLNRDDESKRRLAVEQLESITGDSIEFEPAANASVRKQQYEMLRERINPTPSVEQQTE